MSKDPAFLFYPNDYIGGTMGMTFEEKGAYIELLMLQFNRGHMTSQMIGQTIGQLWVKIQDKFVKDNDGLFFNARLELEIKKRQTFINSRYNNLLGKNQYTKEEGHTDGHMTSRMENENININNKENKGAKKFNFDFIEESYKDIFESWLNYKKERKESYKTQTSLEACYKNLKKLSGNNPETAKEIIENSFANNWSGLFALKNNKTFTPAPIVPQFSSGPDR